MFADHRSRPVRRTLVSIMAAGVLVLTACGSDGGDHSADDPSPTTESIDSATDAPVTDAEDDDGNRTVETVEDGSGSLTGDPALPDGWPIDVLLVPTGFDVTSASADDAGAMWIIITGAADADAVAALDDFAGRLEERGYDVSVHDDDQVVGERPGDQEGERKTAEISIIADGPDGAPQLRLDYTVDAAASTD